MLDKKWLKEGCIFQQDDQFFIGIGPYESRKQPHPTKYSLYTADFFSHTGVFKHPQTSFWVSKKKLLSFLEIHQEKTSPPLWKGPDYPSFKKIFNQFHLLRNQGRLKKVVTAVVSTSLTPPLSLKQRAFCLKNLIQKNHSFVYGMWSPQGGFLGLTPELLFKKEEKLLQTMALAGTSKVEDKGFFKDPKERQEQRIVLEDILQRWRNFPVHTSPVYEHPCGSLKHLCSDIRIQVPKNLSFLFIVQNLHPTPALGGSPKEEALRFLSKYEGPFSRKIFGSPFALYSGPNQSCCVVSIRNIQWNRRSLFLAAGCGLTKKSILEKEWKEIQLKTKAIIKNLWLS